MRMKGSQSARSFFPSMHCCERSHLKVVGGLLVAPPAGVTSGELGWCGRDRDDDGHEAGEGTEEGEAGHAWLSEGWRR